MEINFLDILNNEIPEESQKQIDNIHRLECEEVLDNLGYIILDRNDDNLELHPDIIKSGIRNFRNEYNECYNAFHDFDEFSHLKDKTLTEAEIDFMHGLSSLECEFDLHQYSLETIGSNKILTRILTYRLNMLSVFNVDISNKLPDNIEDIINQLMIWTNTTSQEQVIYLIGHMDEFSETIVQSNTKSDSILHYFAFFKSDEKRYTIPELTQGTNWEFFKEKFYGINKKFTDLLKSPHKRKKNSKEYHDKQLNRLQLRVIQIRLWLLGAYEGALDSDIGPVTVESIQHALDHAIDSSNRKAEEYLLRNIIFYIGDKNWVVNVHFLFKQVFPIFLDHGNEDDKTPETLTEKIMHVIDELESEEEKNSIIEEVKGRIEGSSKEVTKRKVKTRSGKSLLKSLRVFFKNILNLIKDGVGKVKEFLGRLFDRIKNGIRILVREFKKIINMIKTAFAFFFSKRVVKTGSGNEKIITDYDFNFDSFTKVNNIDENLVKEHVEKLNYISLSMEETAPFMGAIVSIILKAIKGPYGWVQICLDAIKYLADTNFSFNKLLFRTFA